MIFKKYITLILFVCISFSCEYQAEQLNRDLLTHAAQALENIPDSALHILNRINTGLLNDSQYAYFVALRVRAKDKVGLNISSDTTVFQSRNYLVNNNDKNAVFACYVSGTVNEELGNPKKAIQDYQLAIKLAGNTDNNLIKGYTHYNIARLYYIQHLYSESLASVRKAYKYYNLSNCHLSKKIYAIELMGLDHLYLSNIDSALLYFDTAMELVSKANDYTNRSRVLYNTSLALRNANEYKIAKEKCVQAMTLTNKTDSTRLGQLYLLLASIYKGTKQDDSAAIYGYQAEGILSKHGSIIDKIDLYRFLILMEEKKGRLERALHYKPLYEYNINLKKEKDNIAMVEQKRYQNHIFQETLNERNRLLIKNLMLRNTIIILCFILILFFIGYLFYWYREKSRRIKSQLEKKITTYKKEANIERLKINSHIKDIAPLDELLEANDGRKAIKEQIKKILGKASWDNLYPVLNIAYEGLFDNIKADFPILTDHEYRVCCLTYAGFGSMEIYKILDTMSPHAVDTQKTKIRRKLGIENYGSLQNFINTKYGIDPTDVAQ